MFQLIYISKARLNITKEDILDILNVARNFNSSNDITGCLVYFNDQFVQLLEGDEDVVRKVFYEIKTDKRHFDVLEVYSEDSDNRVFSDWSMAFHELKEGEAYDLGKEIFVDNLVNFSYLTSKETNSVRLFWMYVNELISKQEQTQ